ncbi:MAG TPA: peptidylprolyl isomerase [Flavobacterium lutivivi]|nr:peptidylprolyl isomerase [Flavobacterium lutivivi]
MKYILILFCLFSVNSFSQSEEIITSKDSLEYYLTKYREISKSVAILKVKMMRVSYIYLDGSKLDFKRIGELRYEIMTYFVNGEKFSDLADKYTMDGNKNGDLGWFEEGMMVKDFENAVKAHKKGDIFTVNIPEKKWYYVVLKTFDDIEKVKLKIYK